jgi:hypothetical protein
MTNAQTDVASGVARAPAAAEPGAAGARLSETPPHRPIRFAALPMKAACDRLADRTPTGAPCVEITRSSPRCRAGSPKRQPIGDGHNVGARAPSLPELPEPSGLPSAEWASILPLLTSGWCSRTAASASATQRALPTTTIRGRSASMSFPRPQSTCSLSSTRRIRIGVVGWVIGFSSRARSDQNRLATVRTIRTGSTWRMRRADRFRWLDKTRGR